MKLKEIATFIYGRPLYFDVSYEQNAGEPATADSHGEPPSLAITGVWRTGLSVHTKLNQLELTDEEITELEQILAEELAEEGEQACEEYALANEEYRQDRLQAEAENRW